MLRGGTTVKGYQPVLGRLHGPRCRTLTRLSPHATLLRRSLHDLSALLPEPLPSVVPAADTAGPDAETDEYSTPRVDILTASRSPLLRKEGAVTNPATFLCGSTGTCPDSGALAFPNGATCVGVSASARCSGTQGVTRVCWCLPTSLRSSRSPSPRISEALAHAKGATSGSARTG